MFRATQNITLSHLCDTKLYDFKGIKKGDIDVNGGDLAFDREQLPPMVGFDSSELDDQNLILWKEAN